MLRRVVTASLGIGLCLALARMTATAWAAPSNLVLSATNRKGRDRPRRSGRPRCPEPKTPARGPRPAQDPSIRGPLAGLAEVDPSYAR